MTYTFHTSFIGSMNAILHIARNTFKKVAFLLHTNFLHVFHSLFNNFVNRKFEHVILYAFSGVLEFPGQVELSMPVGRGTKGAPRPSVGSGMDRYRLSKFEGPF